MPRFFSRSHPSHNSESSANQTANSTQLDHKPRNEVVATPSSCLCASVSTPPATRSMKQHPNLPSPAGLVSSAQRRGGVRRANYGRFPISTYLPFRRGAREPLRLAATGSNTTISQRSIGQAVSRGRGADRRRTAEGKAATAAIERVMMGLGP